MRNKNIFIVYLVLLVLISSIWSCTSKPEYAGTEEVIQTTTTTTERPVVKEKQTTTTTTIQSE